jgi:hypothetical protein
MIQRTPHQHTSSDAANRIPTPQPYDPAGASNPASTPNTANWLRRPKAAFFEAGSRGNADAPTFTQNSAPPNSGNRKKSKAPGLLIAVFIAVVPILSMLPFGSDDTSVFYEELTYSGQVADLYFGEAGEEWIEEEYYKEDGRPVFLDVYSDNTVFVAGEGVTPQMLWDNGQDASGAENRQLYLEKYLQEFAESETAGWLEENDYALDKASVATSLEEPDSASSAVLIVDYADAEAFASDEYPVRGNIMVALSQDYRCYIVMITSFRYDEDEEIRTAFLLRVMDILTNRIYYFGAEDTYEQDNRSYDTDDGAYESDESSDDSDDEEYSTYLEEAYT